MSLNSQTESEEAVLKTTSYTRKSLEPIKEESVCSSTDLKSRSKRLSSRNDSKLLPSIKAPKPCPFTQGECPTKKAIAERRRRSQNDSNRSSLSQLSDTSSQRSYSSLLEKPFVFRRASSLQKAVERSDAKAMKLYLQATETVPELTDITVPTSPYPSGTSMSTTERDKFSDNKSQTESVTTTNSSSLEKQKLQYILGIPPEEGEGETKIKKDDIDKVIVDEQLESSLSGETEAMRQAQRYLRVHRIFEFYQFLMAHLLSALPENPINFLLDLLDRCIVYRAGMGNPPVLYDRKHLEALFNLMDRMRTGYIDKDQYITGMNTLGICSYNSNPPVTENMVSKSFFIEEAYENLVSMLNDIIRRRWIYFNNQPLPIKTPPPTPLYSTHSGKTNASSKF